MRHETRDDSDALERARELGHEHRDASILGVIAAGLGLLLLLLLGLGVAYVTATRLAPSTSDEDYEDPATGPPPVMFAAPQANQSLVRRRQAEVRQRVLHSYTWVDRENRVARIPIERAMELIARNEKLLSALDGRDRSEPQNETSQENEGSE